MKLKLITVLTFLVGVSAYASEELHNAYIIEHKSEVVGKSDNIVAISGQLDDGPIIYRKDSDVNESLDKTSTKQK